MTAAEQIKARKLWVWFLHDVKTRASKMNNFNDFKFNSNEQIKYINESLIKILSMVMRIKMSSKKR